MEVRAVNTKREGECLVTGSYERWGHLHAIACKLQRAWRHQQLIPVSDHVGEQLRLVLRFSLVNLPRLRDLCLPIQAYASVTYAAAG